jgi:hypothetical protein
MSPFERYTNPGVVVRAVLATATVIFLLLGLSLRSGRLLAAAAVFGVVWTLWDLLWNRVLGPGGSWAARVLTEGVGETPAATRPTLDDTVRLLENHLAHGADRHVEIQAAIRLEEIYRTIRKDPERARQILEGARCKYPDAEELKRHDRSGGAGG